MSKLEEAKEILSSLKVPAKQQNGMCCCVLLAMANLTEEQAWGSAANNWIRIHDVIAFANSNYGTTYAENSRETFRKQAMHHFRNAAFIEDKNVDKLRALGFEITLHDKMPDVVLYSEDKDWLYFIESVTSVGPMEPKRIKEIEEMTTGVKAGKIYVTAFLDFKTFKQFSESLAWETEVWIADMPDHMIHLNGDKFLGPR